jgi:hypothetical protein
MKTNILFWSYLAQFLWNVSDKSCRENQNTQFVLIIRIVAVYEISMWHMRIAR